jgi:hypothetical protein
MQPMPKSLPTWHDPKIEWFYASDSLFYPASVGNLKNESRIDYGNDGVEIRKCFDAMIHALDMCEKPLWWLKRFANEGLTNMSRAALAWDPSFFHHHNRTLWPTRIGYLARRPDQMSNRFGINIPHCLKETREFPGSIAVSTEWRQIVEELQPGYAKFFPFQIVFNNQTVDGYSWMVAPILLVGPEYRTGEDHKMYIAVPGDYDRGDDKTMKIGRSKLTGVHWIQTDRHDIFSGEMVRRIAPLILRREQMLLSGLIPISVIED